MKDPYKRLSSEWGSKRRKEDSRAAKSTLKKIPKEELEELVPEQEFRKIPANLVQHAIESYDTILPNGILRLAKALKEAYAEIDRLKGFK